MELVAAECCHREMGLAEHSRHTDRMHPVAVGAAAEAGHRRRRYRGTASAGGAAGAGRTALVAAVLVPAGCRTAEMADHSHIPEPVAAGRAGDSLDWDTYPAAVAAYRSPAAAALEH